MKISISLIVLCSVVFSCAKIEYGCTNNTALNYNPMVDESDNSCIYEISTAIAWESSTTIKMVQGQHFTISIYLNDKLIGENACWNHITSSTYSPIYFKDTVYNYGQSYFLKLIDQDDELFFHTPVTLSSSTQIYLIEY